jgi:chemotaxis protein methyltransferase CheR
MSVSGGPGLEVLWADFEYVRGLVKRQTAISLDDSKRYLVAARLLPVARQEGLESVGSLVARLRSSIDGPLHTRTVEAIATTETSFFRDHHPFEALRAHVLPDLLQRRAASRSLTIWCAACSSGQEPYSLAMLIRESFPQLIGWNVQILASDLSATMVDRATRGEYQQHEVNRGLPAHMLVRYFSQDGGRWRLAPEVRSMVRFFQHNLSRDWTPVPVVDLVLMRNVLIYFEISDRRRVLASIRRHLRPDGYLLLGSAETTLNLDDSYRREPFGRAVFYRPAGGAAR